MGQAAGQAGQSAGQVRQTPRETADVRTPASASPNASDRTMGRGTAARLPQTASTDPMILLLAVSSILGLAAVDRFRRL
jgi:hypothetical protein